MRLVAARALCKITVPGRVVDFLTHVQSDFMNNYMHPQAVIIDSTDAEEDFFLRGFRDQIRGTKSTLIELPDKPGTRLAWLTQLGASALSG